MTKLTSKALAGPDPNPMTVDEVDALKTLCRMLPSNPVIIQIGAERGCSTLAMLEERPDAFILSLDIGERPEERKNLERAGLDWTRVVRGLGRSQNIGLHWPRGWRCDLLYIDGDHRYEGIRRDIEVWVDAVHEDGIIAFHDYIPDPPPHIIGRVARAVDELMAGYEEIQWVNRLKAFRQR